MREFTDQELYLGLEHAKTLNEHAGRAILEKFQLEQPVLAQTLLGVFPSVIADQDQGLAHLFMDLCFDILCTFQHARGSLPSQQALGLDWLQEKAADVDAELKALMSGKSAPARGTSTDNQQQGLVCFMHACVRQHVSDKPAAAEAVRTIETLLFVSVQLFCSVYDAAAGKTLH
ncbi:hypothetical protein NP590_18155 [Methylomonas sp. SURF-2]|uniref:Uncharacterized protein n=1 Tax=Methylomonas subterranea TaxID=2952225 RepID=A0ABT1TLF0_9GAMM|nr:hypothetical protein [Methylomonas sp. SURF-2]MCQ8106038.1 hypothetical protein [Methylomonas sp. SURF-2]